MNIGHFYQLYNVRDILVLKKGEEWVTLNLIC